MDSNHLGGLQPTDSPKSVYLELAARLLIIVHCHFWTPDKHGEPVPVGMQAAQDLLLNKVEVGFLKMRLAAGLHLAQLGLQVAVAFDKGRRVLLQPQRLIPHLQTGGPAYSGMATGDNFALFFDILFAGLGILTVAISHSYLQKRGMREGEFHILMLAAVIGMMVLASATSLVTVFLGLELLSIALYVASGFARDDSRSQEAAAKYLLVGGFASAFVLYGMALIYGASGTTLLPDIAKQVSTLSPTNPLLILGVVLMGVGFAFKVSAAPFHMWTPDVYQGAPIPVTAFMSVGTKA